MCWVFFKCFRCIILLNFIDSFRSWVYYFVIDKEIEVKVFFNFLESIGGLVRVGV